MFDNWNRLIEETKKLNNEKIHYGRANENQNRKDTEPMNARKQKKTKGGKAN